MTPLTVLSDFLAQQFPFWGLCQLRLSPCDSTLYVHCQTIDSWRFVLKDRFAISKLDIGVRTVVVTHKGHADFTIAMPYDVSALK